MEKVFITQFIHLIHYTLPNQAHLGKFCVIMIAAIQLGNAANTGFLQAWYAP